MKTAIALVLLVLGFGTGSAPDTPRRELIRALDRFYTWGDVVERFKCRVHGRWLDHGGPDTDQGQFWGDLEYAGGSFTYKPLRSLGRGRDPGAILGDIEALIEQAGLLPTGIPLPDGTVSKPDGGAGAKTELYAVRSSANPEAPPLRFRTERGRVVGVTLPRGRGSQPIDFRIKSIWIPGDRYLVTRLRGNRGAKKNRPAVAYHYQFSAGNYFPRAITEERGTTRLSLIFYWYDIDMRP